MNAREPLPDDLLREGMRADHDRANALFDRVIECVESDDRERIASVWTELETMLIRHLDVEDDLLIPRVAVVSMRDARTLLEEHKHFRKKLAELSTAVDLHTLRLEPVRDFVDQLRAHARREDATLYAFGDEHLSDTDREAVLAALTASRRVGIKRPGPF